MRFSAKILLLFITAILFQTVAHAQIKLPKVFGDNMVLQRELKIPVWGIATPGATIIAELGNTKATTKADQEGKWTVHLPKFKVGGPYTLKIYEEGKTRRWYSIKRNPHRRCLAGFRVNQIWNGRYNRLKMPV